MSRSVAIWKLLLVGALVAGCADRPVAPYPTSTPSLARNSVLGPGDVFEVRVFGEEDLTGDYQVAADGTVNFPLVGQVQVQGLQPGSVAAEIERLLADGYIKKPEVSLFVKKYNSRKISVFGQVRKPGTFAYSENMSIVEAITSADGFTALAKRNSVRVTRSTDGETLRHFVAVEDIGEGKSPNFFLQPGDVVFVNERTF